MRLQKLKDIPRLTVCFEATGDVRASTLCLHDNSMRDIRVMCMKNILYTHETKKIRQTETEQFKVCVIY